MEYMNLDTGEITFDFSRPKLRVASCKQTIGEEVKYPSDCVTADSLKESLKNLDANLHYKASIDFEYLLQSLEEKLLSPQEVAVLSYLGKNLVAWNYWMGNKADLYVVVSQTNIGRVLRTLAEKNAITIMHEHKPFKNDVVIKINPVIAFRGSSHYRRAAITRWYI